jgi:capsular exopolysaccharide synthesis family protein
MCRFYNALREASRFQPSAEGERERLKPQEKAPAVPEEPLVAASAATQTESPVVESFTGSGRLSAFNEPKQEVFGRHAKVTIDQTARLIPHAVDPAVVEHYRKLRTKIMQQHATKPFRSLVVTSPHPGEGKSVTALNLGLSFAMLANFRVCVVDGDLRKGSMGKWLGVSDRPGLSNLIDGSAQLEDVVLKSDESPMCFVVSGTSDAAPAELLNSDSLRGHFQQLSGHFDIIVVDSPPVNLITDTQLLAASCDAVLLVARAFSTTSRAFEKTLQDLAPFRVIGAVLNGGIKMRNRGGYGYGHSFGQGYY